MFKIKDLAFLFNFREAKFFFTDYWTLNTGYFFFASFQ